MQFNVSVKSSVFAAKYFDLREFARKSNALFDLQPLSEADANELEVLFIVVIIFVCRLRLTCLSGHF